ncbi:LPS-assembly lipoprotein [Rhodobacter sp. 140A]|uniref:LPS-assembly lipoprotein LptE n=1 Tax=bioreactor metagenome TaxID=1076179 RepID=A0A644T1U1_9ZZZZ|nr:LPS-assembly lipoprotein [Rhodobacter sp. 140A]
MSSSDRRTFLLLAAAALAGCGFTPAYGPQGGGTKLLGRVQTDSPATRDDFALIRRLSERLGPLETAHYRLAYTVKTQALGQAITPSNATTRYSLAGTVDYTLHDIGTDAVLLTGKVASFTSWSATGTVVATDAAEEDAHRRLMSMLADQIVTRLLAQAGSLPQ